MITFKMQRPLPIMEVSRVEWVECWYVCDFILLFFYVQIEKALKWGKITATSCFNVDEPANYNQVTVMGGINITLHFVWLFQNKIGQNCTLIAWL